MFLLQALGALYLIHDSLKNIAMWNYSGKVYTIIMITIIY